MPAPRATVAATTEIATAAGEVLRSHVDALTGVVAKHVPQDPARRHDIVTDADYAAEAHIVERIREIDGDAVILAEESGLSHGDVEHVVDIEDLWVVDPLDGTINFAHGIPMFCVSIARYRRGALESATIHAPLLDETFEVAGGVATLNGVTIACAPTTSIDGAFVGIGGTPTSDDSLVVLHSGCIWRRLGSAALCLAYVACGRLDLYVQWGRLGPWDWAAGRELVLAAGGAVVTPELGPFPLDLATWRGLRAGAPALVGQLAR